MCKPASRKSCWSDWSAYCDCALAASRSILAAACCAVLPPSARQRLSGVPQSICLAAICIWAVWSGCGGGSWSGLVRYSFTLSILLFQNLLHHVVPVLYAVYMQRRVLCHQSVKGQILQFTLLLAIAELHLDHDITLFFQLRGSIWTKPPAISTTLSYCHSLQRADRLRGTVV